MSGQLILVATPIGNLGDISERMKQVLEQADLIACEDSRHSGRLVKHMGITSPKYIVVNDHTERDACNGIVEAIMGGKTVALITDAVEKADPAASDEAAAYWYLTAANGIGSVSLSLLTTEFRDLDWSPVAAVAYELAFETTLAPLQKLAKA